MNFTTKDIIVDKKETNLKLNEGKLQGDLSYTRGYVPESAM